MPCSRLNPINLDDLSLRFASGVLALGESLAMIARLLVHSRVHATWKMAWPRAEFQHVPECSLADTCGVRV